MYVERALWHTTAETDLSQRPWSAQMDRMPSFLERHKPTPEPAWTNNVTKCPCWMTPKICPRCLDEMIFSKPTPVSSDHILRATRSFHPEYPECQVQPLCVEPVSRWSLESNSTISANSFRREVPSHSKSRLRRSMSSVLRPRHLSLGSLRLRHRAGRLHVPTLSFAISEPPNLNGGGPGLRRRY